MVSLSAGIEVAGKRVQHAAGVASRDSRLIPEKPARGWADHLAEGKEASSRGLLLSPFPA